MQAANEGSHTLYFLDPRPKSNAMANSLRGGGYEAVGPRTEYADCVLQFGNIEVIDLGSEELSTIAEFIYSKKIGALTFFQFTVTPLICG